MILAKSASDKKIVTFLLDIYLHDLHLQHFNIIFLKR